VTWGGKNFFHIEAVYTVMEACAIGLIAITQEILGCRVPWECLNHLLSGPLGSRTFGNIEVDNFTPFMFEHEKDIQDSECRRRHSEEVD